MASVVQRLRARGLLATPPNFLAQSTQLEVVMGSVAYGVSGDTSDMDITGFCIPPRDHVFPHLRGEVIGFSTPGPAFGQFQQHHIADAEAGKEYDVCIYGIVKFFRLCMEENNPNMVDVLFVPRRCVLYSTGVGELVRDMGDRAAMVRMLGPDVTARLESAGHLDHWRAESAAFDERLERLALNLAVHPSSMDDGLTSSSSMPR